MKTALHRIVKGVLPDRCWIQLQSVRSRNHQVRWLKQEGVLDIAQQFVNHHGTTVLHGPFSGMKYPVESALSRHSVPRLLGSYERELHDVIKSTLGCRYDLTIDIGGAEGYYAVGFALKGESPVVSFDTDHREVAFCEQMARLNGVGDRITARSWCSRKTLRSLTAGKRCFIFSDCEGYEAELFDDAAVAAMRRSDALIEIHGQAYEVLTQRFSKTHTLQVLTASERSPSDYPELACLGTNASRAVWEYRDPGQRWLYARSREAD